MRLLACLALCLPLLTQAADPLDQARELVNDSHRELAAGQTRIEQLDDEQQRLAAEYIQLQRRITTQRQYLQRLRSRAAAQQAELDEQAIQRQQLTVTREQIEPLLRRMVDTLAGVIDADLPFNQQERGGRLQRLQQLVDDSASSDSEKLRRILDAYRIELDYSYQLEAVRGPITEPAEAGPGQRPREVELIRLGRVALFYLSLDHREAAIWDQPRQRWQPLPASTIPALQQALRIAHQQAAPALLVLPLPLPSTDGDAS